MVCFGISVWAEEHKGVCTSLQWCCQGGVSVPVVVVWQGGHESERYTGVVMLRWCVIVQECGQKSMTVYIVTVVLPG